jgi:hypothetical protein
MREDDMIESETKFAAAASAEAVDQLAERLRARNIEVVVVEDGAEARAAVLARVPEGAEVYSAKSKTLQEAGITEVIQDSGRYDALRPRYLKMDRKTQMREIRKLIGAPDYMLGSVNAITEAGVLVTASATSNQLGPYANTAGKVILVIGSQKLVPDLETAMRRIYEYVLPWEDEQVRKVLPSGSYVAKILLIEREAVPGRMTVVLVRQPIGI